MFDYDTPAARAKYRSFKSRLTRAKNLHNHADLVALWDEFKDYYDSRDWPMPDDWRRWEAAADDAKRKLLDLAAFGSVSWK